MSGTICFGGVCIPINAIWPVVVLGLNGQVVADGALDNYESEIVELGTGCSVRVHGTVAESQGKGQDREVQASSVEVLGWVDDPETYPIAKKRHTFEYLRTVAHLRPRTNTFGAIARVRQAITKAVHDYFDANGFLWVNTPIITASDCEGAGDLFRVSTLDQVNRAAEEPFAEDFFGTETFLAVSGQLNVESYCLALSKVYTFGPTFRAEKSKTRRHLTEFWMLEPEFVYAGLTEVCDLAEGMIRYTLEQVLEHNQQDLADLERDPAVLQAWNTEFPRLRYDEAAKMLMEWKAEGKYESEFQPGDDLGAPDETMLGEHYGCPVMVTHWPAEVKAGPRAGSAC